MMEIISFLFGIVFSTNVIQGLSEGQNLYYIHSLDNMFYYMDRYEINGSKVIINRQIVSLTELKQSLIQGRYYMIDSAKKDSVQQVILQGMEATKQSVKNVFKVQSSIWQEEAIKHLPPKIKKEDIKWGNTIDLMDDYIWDNKARLAIIQLRLFSKSTTDMNGIPIGISLHGYCIYDTAQRKTLSYYLQWEVEWYD